MDELGTQVAVLTERVNTLEQVVIDEKKRLNGNLERIGATLAALNEKLDTVRLESLRKPSWAVTCIITILSSLLVGCVALFTRI